MVEGVIYNRILVVDDDHEVLNVYSTYLTKEGYEVMTTSNGRDVQDLVKSYDPHVILLDLYMNDISGFEVLKQGVDCDNDIPIIIISGVGNTTDVIKSLRLGAWDYLTKPLPSLDVLKHAVNRALEKLRLTRENRYYQENLESMIKEKSIQLAETQCLLADHIQKIHNVFKITPVGIGVTDNRILKEVNDTLCDMTGYSGEELLGQNARILYPDDVEFNKAFAFKLCDLNNYGLNNIELKFKRKDGRIIDVLLNSACLNKDNPSLGAIFAVLDITARKDFERKLEENTTILSDILEVTLSGYWDWHIPNGTEYFSPAFKNMFGYEDHELPNIPESWQRLIMPEDLEKALIAFKRHVRSRGSIPYYIEVRYRHKDGSIKWVVCAGRVIEWSEDWKPIRVVGCHIDVTDRRKAEEMIKIERDKAQLYLDIAQTIFVALDTDGKVILINKAGCNLIGIDECFLIGQDWFANYIPEKSRPEVLKEFKRLIMGEKGDDFSEFENTVLRANGEVRVVKWRNIVIRDENNKIMSTFSSGEDITDQRRAEKLLEEYWKKAENLLKKNIKELQSRESDIKNKLHFDQNGR